MPNLKKSYNTYGEAHISTENTVCYLESVALKHFFPQPIVYLSPLQLRQVLSQSSDISNIFIYLSHQESLNDPSD